MEARAPELQRIDRNFAVAVSTALRTKSITDGGYVPTPKLTQAEEVLLEEFAGPLSHLRPGFTWSECDRCNRRRIVSRTTSAGACKLTQDCDGLAVVIKSNTAAKLPDPEV